MPALTHLLVFGAFLLAAWFLFIYFYPRLLLTVYKRAILVKGFGEGPIPLNSLYTQTPQSFAQPIPAQPASGSSLARIGVNRDTLMTLGWLDLRQGAQILHVPDMTGRYYSLQLTDPSRNINFAYVGTRATGSQAGDYLITGPGWDQPVPEGLSRIAAPNHAVLVVGRVLVRDEADLPAAYDLSKQITLTPQRDGQPG